MTCVSGASIGCVSHKTAGSAGELPDTSAGRRWQDDPNTRRRKPHGTEQGGRPKLPDGEKRDCPVKVYFDRTNYTKLVRRSRRMGRPLSEIVYELAVNGYVKEAVPQGVAHCLRALAGMANNLNQLAHLAHIHGPQHVADENKRLSREISGLIVELNKQL